MPLSISVLRSFVSRHRVWFIGGASLIPGAIAIANSLTPITTAPIAVEFARPQQPTIDQAWENNPKYCDDKPIEQCYEQLLLRLWNTDPDTGRPGTIAELVAREASRIRSRAVSEQSNSKNERCFNRSLEVCLNSIANNVLSEMEQSATPTEKAAAFFRYAAVGQARFGGTAPTAAPTTFTDLAVVENFETQLHRHYALSQQQAVQQLQQDRPQYQEPEL